MMDEYGVLDDNRDVLVSSLSFQRIIHTALASPSTPKSGTKLLRARCNTLEKSKLSISSHVQRVPRAQLVVL
jgi:hypothetical protein